MISTDAQHQEIAAEADDIGVGFQALFRRKLLLWVIRWAIGFALIAWATRQWSGVDWLWWAGAAVAALSLVALLVTRFMIRGRVASIHADLSAASESAE